MMATGSLSLTPLPPTLENAVRQQLDKDEVVLWQTQPNPKRMLIKSLPIIFFAIPWTAFALFWMAGAAGFKIPSFNSPANLFPLFGIPFVFIGLAMLATPIHSYTQAKHTIYVITDRRAMIVIKNRTSAVCHTFLPDTLNRITTKVNADGSGDILFDPERQASNEKSKKIPQDAFYSVADVAQVEQLLRDVAMIAGSSPPTDS